MQLAKQAHARGNCLCRRGFAPPTRIRSHSYSLHALDSIIISRPVADSRRRFPTCVRPSSSSWHRVRLLVMGARGCSLHPCVSPIITHCTCKGHLLTTRNRSVHQYGCKQIIQVACISAHFCSFSRQSVLEFGIMSAAVTVGVWLFAHLGSPFAYGSSSQAVLHGSLKITFSCSEHARS